MKKIDVFAAPADVNTSIIYNGLDTLHTFALYEYLKNNTPEWARPAIEYEHAMLGPVMTMMRRGLRIDQEQNQNIIAQLTENHSHYNEMFQRLLRELFGIELNVNSHVQMKFLFFELLGIPEVTKVVKGEIKLSVSREILEKITEDYWYAAPFAKLLMNIKDLSKQIEFLSKPLDERGRFRYGFNIAGTETWRWSSSEHPLNYGGNVQNIPPVARRCIVADPGYILMYADQQGAEARLVAYLSGDPAYIEAVESGDSHTMVASMVFGIPATKEAASKIFYRNFSYRDIAKRAAHGSNYNGSARTLARVLRVEEHVTKNFQTLYFKRFPGIKRWHQKVAQQLQEKGYIETPFGFRRTFWGRRWDDATLREAIAFVPQSCVGVLTAIALWRLWDRFERTGEVQILANIHDAVLIQIDQKRVNELVPQILDLLRIPIPITDCNGVTREVIIPFDAELGLNWQKYDANTNPDGMRRWKSVTSQTT